MAAISEVRVPVHGEIVIPVTTTHGKQTDEGVEVSISADVANARLEINGHTIGKWSSLAEPAPVIVGVVEPPEA